jgi:hypothetical protein
VPTATVTQSAEAAGAVMTPPQQGKPVTMGVPTEAPNTAVLTCVIRLFLKN